MCRGNCRPPGLIRSEGGPWLVCGGGDLRAGCVWAGRRFTGRGSIGGVKYTQLTDFTDSAVQPALSPRWTHAGVRPRRGHVHDADQIYVKMLPNGEARRVTDDSRLKYGLSFSPDGSEIAYTVLEGPTFSTYVVSALGGEPRLMFKNAAGLVLAGSAAIPFSQAPTGIHLSVVKSSVTREDVQDLYAPAHERGMAHYSFPSPDRRWAIVVEMNGNGEWAPCRLIAVEGQRQTRSVGPAGGCTSAGWSPDGHWMYFAATVEGRSHLWQQRFPMGEPEQITSGPTEEDGIAVEPDGHSLDYVARGLPDGYCVSRSERGSFAVIRGGGALVADAGLQRWRQDHLLSFAAAGQIGCGTVADDR